MRRFILVAILFAWSFFANSQDSSITESKVKTPWSKPKTATLMSAVIPVSGQVYVNGTRKWWKIPLVYGLGGWLGYNVSYHHVKYKQFQRTLFELQDGDDNTTYSTALTANFDETGLRTRKDYYRRNRDVNIIYMTLLYAANIVDANVDAHLAEFRVSNDMIMSFNPSLNPANNLANRSIGLTLNVKFL